MQPNCLHVITITVDDLVLSNRKLIFGFSLESHFLLGDLDSKSRLRLLKFK